MQLRLTRENVKDPVIIEFRDKTRILFSYECPVAAFVPDRGYIRTDIDTSDTTDTRIRNFVNGKPCDKVDQSEIFELITRRVPKSRHEI